MSGLGLESAEVRPGNSIPSRSLQSIRILFNSPNPRLQGGPPTHLPILEQSLRRLTNVFTYEYGRKSNSEILIRKLFGRVIDLIRLRALCQELRPNLIHHNSAFDYFGILRDLPLMFVLKREKIPVFLKLHGSVPEALPPSSWLLNLAGRMVLRGAARIGVLSAAEQREFEEAFPCVRGKVRIVKNIINTEFVQIERHEAHRPTVLFLSRFIRKKGPFDLLHAVPLVLKKEPGVEFLFVGDGEDVAPFEREVAFMNLGESVRRIPHADCRERLALYAKAWMLVFPTYFPEGMPMVVGEAMAAGVPVVSTPTRFSRSYMIEGVHVLYNQPADVDGVAANILRLCQDNDLRNRMSRANRRLALEYFSKDCVVQEYTDIYQEVLSNYEGRDAV